MSDGLLQRLDRWRRERPTATALVYLNDAETEEARVDYRDLHLRIIRIEAWLRGRLSVGDRVLLAPRSELHYLVGLLGCLRAGVIAVPTLPPTNERSLSRIKAHGDDCHATALLGDDWVMSRHDRLQGDSANWLRGIDWLNLETVLVEEGGSGLTPVPLSSMAGTAYLQYTSGSTSRPKGVMVTHSNLADQLSLLETTLGHAPGTAVCNWMPLHHDFGLVMTLQALYSGGTAVLLPPVPAVQRPERWLRAISNYRAVTSAAPNFMFDRCIERIGARERAGLDLSSLRNMLNAAEPIQPATVRAFSEAFEASGFSRSAWMASFGLAEATLMVSMARPSAGYRIEGFDEQALLARRVALLKGGRELVSCGPPLVEDSVAIVNAETNVPSGPEEIGEIWVSFDSVASGYWGREDETIETFRARIQGAGRPYLRTGDLGFIRDGELFIAGRLKDLIIVRGENHYPQDIEYSVGQAHEAIEPNAAAAFAEERADGEALVIVTEVRREALKRLVEAEVFAAIRHVVAEQHGLETARIVLLRPGGLPRTSSGKVQRRGCRRDLQADALPVVAQWSVQSAALPDHVGLGEVEDQLADFCRRLLGQGELQRDVSLFDHGVDSLKAAEILLMIEERWGVGFDLADFADASSIRQLAQAIRNKRTPPERSHRAAPSTFYLGDQGEPDGASSAALIDRLAPLVAAWDGERAGQDSFVLGRNLRGTKPPLFWVFQGQQEFVNLAEALGTDQPLYGMRSGHQVMDYTEANIQTLATRYRREIQSLKPEGPYLLGGNCQGGLIALAVAQQLLRLHQPVSLVALLEWAFPPQPYLGRVALFWGDRSVHKNPYFRFRRPELYWRRGFADYSVDIVEGGHGEFFSGRKLMVLAGRLMGRMAESLAQPPLLLPASAMRASYRLLDLPPRLEAGDDYVLTVAIRNDSAYAWAETGRSGLQLGNHWVSGRQEALVWLDGATELPAIGPGETVEVKLRIKVPTISDELFLQIDLVEEGVAWLSERGVPPLTVPINLGRVRD